MVKELIDQLPEESAKIQLLGLFEKLLRKYSHQLRAEDSYEELRLFFFELLETFVKTNQHFENEGSAVVYISTAIRNRYIAISKKLADRMEYSFSDMEEYEIMHLENLTPVVDQAGIDSYFPTNHSLSEREKVILKLFFVEGYSISDIADRLHISRQAANQSKLRAIRKIRQALSNNSGFSSNH